MQVKRGQKLCKNCNNVVGARSLICKHCNTPFVIKNTEDVDSKPKRRRRKRFKKYSRVENWKELQVGDRIKVVGRSGSYYIGEDGDKQYMTEAGIYTIQSHDDNGLVVYAAKGGFGYIYMGQEVKSSMIPNMYRSPHKILKVNIPERV